MEIVINGVGMVLSSFAVGFMFMACMIAGAVGVVGACWVFIYMAEKAGFDCYKLREVMK